MVTVNGLTGICQLFIQRATTRSSERRHSIAGRLMMIERGLQNKKKKKKNTKKSRCFHYENNDCSTNYFSFDIFQSRRCAFLKSKRNGFWNSCIALCKSFIRSFLYSGWFFFLITGGVTCPGIVSHQRTQSLPLAHPAPLTDHTSHPPRAAKRSNQSSKCMYHLAFIVYACACVFIIRSNTCQFHS